MSHRDDQWKHDLVRDLRRAGEELARGFAHHASVHATRLREQAERQRVTEQEKRLNRQQRRRLERQQRRRREHIERMERTSRVEGGTFIAFGILAAVLLLVLGAEYWWLVFPAFFLSLRGAQIVGYHFERDRHPERFTLDGVMPPPLPTGATVAAADPRSARIDALCQKLLAVLKDAPASVRELLHEPEKTVETLRRTSHDLLRREATVRELVQPQEDERLARERTALAARVELERDAVSRARLAGALQALDDQIAQRAELQRSATRLEAEQARLTYTLEGLYAQLVRLKAAGDETRPTLDASVRTSLEQLRAEVNAVAEAIEQVNASELAHVAVAPGPDPELASQQPARGRVRD